MLNFFQIIMWVWLISFGLALLWYKYNPNFLKNFYRNYDLFEYSFYLNLIYLLTFLIAPFLFIVILYGEISSYIFILLFKLKLRIKIMKIKNPEIRKILFKELKKI